MASLDNNNETKRNAAAAPHQRYNNNNNLLTKFKVWGVTMSGFLVGKYNNTKLGVDVVVVVMA